MKSDQLILDLDVATSFAPEDFLISASNQLARDHLLAWPNWSGRLALLQGPEQSGKSHLAQIWAEHADAQTVSPENLDGAQTDVFSSNSQSFLIEDVDRAGFDEAALFHLLNHAMRHEHSVLMTAREQIINWPFATNDVKSRARLATFLQLEAPDDLLLTQLLVKHLSDRQVHADAKIIKYIVTRMERSAREAAKIAQLLDEASLRLGRPISQGIASEILNARHENRAE